MLLTMLLLISAVSSVPKTETGEITICKGWNLVYSFAGPDQLINQEKITKEDIKAVFGLGQTNKEFFMLYPKNDQDTFKRLDSRFVEDDEQITRTAFWVYSDKELCQVGVQADLAEPLDLDQLILFKGWNFLGITEKFYENQEFDDFEISSLKGSCNIEKAYLWDASDQAWIDVKDESISPMYLNMGLVVKVSSECNLKAISSGVVPPPQLPN